jgi:hypothetical protein
MADIDIGLKNVMRGFSESVDQLKKSYASHPFGSTPAEGTLGPEFMRDIENAFKKHVDGMSDAGEEHVKGFKKASDEFLEKSTKANLMMAPLYEGLHLFAKYAINYPTEIMGGAQGRAARHGRNIATDVGQIGFDIASAISAAFGPMGIMLGLGLQAAGKSGGATLLGNLIPGVAKATTEAGLKRTYAEDFEAMRWQNEQAAMFSVRTGRLQTQAGAWGAGPNFAKNMIDDLVKELNENPDQMQSALAEAFKVGGVRGIENIDSKIIQKLVREGYGSASEIIAMQAAAGRYKYGPNDLADMTNRTGLSMNEVLPFMQRTATQYYMYGGQTASEINKFVGNTELGSMNLQAGLGMLSQPAQGASSAGGEAVEMIQYSEYKKEFPTASYLDFLEDKRNGFASKRWRQFVGKTASRLAGTQIGRLTAGALGLGAPGTIEKTASEYAQGMGEDVYRTGSRITSAEEGKAGAYGTQHFAAMEASLQYTNKFLGKFSGRMKEFADNMRDIASSTDDIVTDTIETRRRIREEVKLNWFYFGKVDKDGNPLREDKADKKRSR